MSKISKNQALFSLIAKEQRRRFLDYLILHDKNIIDLYEGPHV